MYHSNVRPCLVSRVTCARVGGVSTVLLHSSTSGSTQISSNVFVCCCVFWRIGAMLNSWVSSWRKRWILARNVHASTHDTHTHTHKRRPDTQADTDRHTDRQTHTHTPHRPWRQAVTSEAAGSLSRVSKLAFIVNTLWLQ